ncbi:MAG: hypothetical protein ACREMT_11380, partial [Vulcanimicrobiaceae bacterium]
SNMASPQVPSFELAGFQVHEGGHDTDTQSPQYLSETEKMRAVALIRFTAPATGLCNAYELSTQQDDGKIHRIGPLHVAVNPNSDNTFPVEKQKAVKALVVLFDAQDVQAQALPLDIDHRTLGVECVRGSDGEVFFSQLYHVDPVKIEAPTPA